MNMTMNNRYLIHIALLLLTLVSSSTFAEDDPTQTIDPPSTYIALNQDLKNTTYYYGTFYEGNYIYQAPESVEVWYAREVSDGFIRLEKSTDNIIDNGCGVILRANQAEVTLTRYEGSDPGKTSELSGADDAQTTPDYTNNIYYVLSYKDTHGVAFYKFTGAALPAHKAFYKVSKNASAHTALLFDFRDDVTGIDKVGHTTDCLYESNGEVAYTLQGIPVSLNDLKKGCMYIVKGRKVFVR